MALAQRCLPNSLALTGTDAIQKREELQSALKRAASTAATLESHENATLYVGTAGAAYALHELSKKPIASQCIDFSLKHASRELLTYTLTAYTNHPGKPGKKQSVFIGDSGALLVASLVSSDDPEVGDSSYYAEQYKGILPQALDAEEDEVLFGRAGWLLGLLQLQRRCGVDVSNEARQVIRKMVSSGRDGAANLLPRRKDQLPNLFYAWHYKFYIGAAHGLFGIALSLIRSEQHWPSELNMRDDVRSLLEFLLSLECDADGNPAEGGYYPTRVFPTTKQPLVHWCHGSPGAIMTFAAAHESPTIGEQKYRDAADRAAAAVWHHGLLHKGPGLCHGIAGNAYALARNATSNGEAAVRFAEFASSAEGLSTWESPDHPASLYEGCAGLIPLIGSMLEGESVALQRMPLYDE
jgi:lantibiotic modifying enzyme